MSRFISIPLNVPNNIWLKTMEPCLSILNQLAKTTTTRITLAQSVHHGYGVFLKNHFMKTQVNLKIYSIPSYHYFLYSRLIATLLDKNHIHLT
jgi:hypothetical protein